MTDAPDSLEEIARNMDAGIARLTEFNAHRPGGRVVIVCAPSDARRLTEAVALMKAPAVVEVRAVQEAPPREVVMRIGRETINHTSFAPEAGPPQEPYWRRFERKRRGPHSRR